MYTIIKARTKEQYDEIIKLFQEYQIELGKKLCFQNFEDELKNIPGNYGMPDGELLLIYDTKTNLYAACVGLRKINNYVCEMKRLFVRPDFRKHGYGKVLTEYIIKIAEKKNYKTMVLDTLKELKPAINLYKKFGFREIEPYYENPLKGVIYMSKELNKSGKH